MTTTDAPVTVEPDWLNADTCIENMQIAYEDATEDEDETPVDTVVSAGDLGVLIGLAEYAVRHRLTALASAPAEPDARERMPKHWMPIDSAPRDRQIIRVLVPLKDGGFIEGAAYFDPDAYNGTWWWDGTNKSDYFTDPISECNHGDPLYWLIESDTGEQASSLGFMSDRPVSIANTASAPAGDGVEDDKIVLRAVEQVMRGFSFETLAGPENLRARLSLCARQAVHDTIAALARPRAAEPVDGAYGVHACDDRSGRSRQRAAVRLAATDIDDSDMSTNRPIFYRSGGTCKESGCGGPGLNRRFHIKER